MLKKIILFVSLLFLSCTFAGAKGVAQTQVEKLRVMQTRCYDLADRQKVLQAAVNVLQDSGYVIQNIDYDFGFLQARKVFKSHYVSKKRIAGWSTVLAATTAYTVFSYGSTAYSMYEPSRRVMNEMKDKTSVSDVNVFVETLDDNKTRIRFNAVEKILQNADGYSFTKAAPMRVLRVYKPKIYNEFFAQVENILFFEEI